MKHPDNVRFEYRSKTLDVPVVHVSVNGTEIHNIINASVSMNGKRTTGTLEFIAQVNVVQVEA